jgi:uncharacterized membrane protein
VLEHGEYFPEKCLGKGMKMVKRRFPEPFKHEHPPVRDIKEIIDAQLTFGQKVSDWVAANLGSWRFLIIQTVMLMLQ